MKPPNKPARYGNDAASSIGTAHGEDALDTDLAPFLEWLADFEASHGRALRVLHVGNAVEPSDGAFDDPTLGQHDEALDLIGPFEDSPHWALHEKTRISAIKDTHKRPSY